MLRVAHTITRLAGGPSYRTVMLTKAMNTDTVHSKLFYGSRDKWDPGHNAYEDSGLPVPALKIPEMKRNIYPKLDLMALWKLTMALKEYNPHVIHTHESKDGFLARLAGLFLGTPAIVRTYHGLIYYDNFFGPKTKIIQPIFVNLERFTNLFTDSVISIGDSLEPHIHTRFGLVRQEKVTTIPNPFILEPFLKVRRRYFLRKELGLPSRAKILTTVANFQPPKDHMNVLDAFALLVERNPKEEYHLCLVGNGPLEGDIRNKIEQLGLQKRVHLLGYRTDMPAIYGSSHLSFLGSSTEGTPGVIVESFASGTPAVATDVGATCDVIRDWGTLVPPHNPLALCQGIEHELSLKRDMKRVRQEVQAIHDVDRVAKATLELYGKILSSKGITP